MSRFASSGRRLHPPPEREASNCSLSPGKSELRRTAGGKCTRRTTGRRKPNRAPLPTSVRNVVRIFRRVGRIFRTRSIVRDYVGHESLAAAYLCTRDYTSRARSMPADSLIIVSSVRAPDISHFRRVFQFLADFRKVQSARGRRATPCVVASHRDRGISSLPQGLRGVGR